MRLQNDAAIPMTVRAEQRSSAGVRIEPARVERVVPPKSVDVIALELTSETPLELTQEMLFATDWTVEYRPDGLPPADIPGTSRFWIEPVFRCSARDVAPAIDGKLEDWAEPGITWVEPAWTQIGGWAGNEDLSFTLTSAYDSDNVYLAIDVRDNQLDPENEVVRIFIDARPASKREPLTWKEPSEEYLQLILKPCQRPVLQSGDAELPVPEGTRIAAAHTELGYTIEIALPADYLSRRQGTAWADFRLNAMIVDWDPEDNTHGVLWWRPNWFDRSDTARFGVFVRDM